MITILSRASAGLANISCWPYTKNAIAGFDTYSIHATNSSWIYGVLKKIIEYFRFCMKTVCRSSSIEMGVLFTKLFWPTVRKICSSDREKLLKFKAEGREFAKFLRSLEQFIQTVKGQNAFLTCSWRFLIHI